LSSTTNGSATGGRAKSASTGAELLKITGLKKAFAGVPALRGVDLDIRAGEIHGLLGANGCGKSTLIKILAGFYFGDDGEISINGVEHKLPLGPRGLSDSGIAFVHQDLGLVPSLTVLEHMALDSNGTKPGLRRISWKKERSRVEGLLNRFDLDLDADAKIDTLSPVQKAMVAIVRAVGHPGLTDGKAGSLLVLDEPTVFLPRDEINALFSLLRKLKSQGDSVLLVSHDLDEVLEITDRVTVFRDGSLVGTRNTSDCTRQDVVEMILGSRDVQGKRQVAKVRTDIEPRLAARNVDGERVRNLSIDLRAGEVVGVTGLAGSGFEELPELLFGARPWRAGTLTVNGKDVKSPTPKEMMSHQVVLVPSDRKADGGAQELTVLENLSLPFFSNFARGWSIRWNVLRERAEGISQKFNVTPKNVDLELGKLSGGNQQKAMLGKWLQTKPTVMLLNEPTQGVDVGARREIFKLLREAVTDDMAILCATSDYEQLVELADRVLILADGEVREELHGSEITKESMAEAIYSQGAK
jgi:ribose transport system ATP-binding protein